MSRIENETRERSVGENVKKMKLLTSSNLYRKGFFKEANIRSPTKCIIRQGKIRIVVKHIYYENGV